MKLLATICIATYAAAVDLKQHTPELAQIDTTAGSTITSADTALVTELAQVRAFDGFEGVTCSFSWVR